MGKVWVTTSWRGIRNVGLRIRRLRSCKPSLVVIPTAGRDLISGTVSLPLFCHGYRLVILEGSMGSAVRVLQQSSTPLLLSLYMPSPLTIDPSLRSG